MAGKLADRVVVSRDTAADTLLDGVGVADYKAGQAQGILQNLPEQEFVHRAGHAVQIVERRHRGLRPGTDRRLEGPEVQIIEQAHGHIDRVVIPAALGDPALSGVPGDVHHGGEVPGNAPGMGFPGGHAGGFLHEVWVKGTGFREGEGVHRAIAVDHVQPEKQGEAQPALLHGDLCSSLVLVGSCTIREPTPPARISSS